MIPIENVSLAAARAEIDSIDDRILDLVERRLSLSRRIAAAKGSGDRLKLCPQRQRRVVERLQARARGVPAAAVAHVWRELMAHSLEAQAPTTFVLCTAGDAEAATRRLRDAYGSAPAVVRAETADAALAEAAEREAVAVLDSGHGCALAEGLTAFEMLGDLVLIGRVAAEDAGWSPASWRARPAAQMPDYPDAEALREAEARLEAAPALVTLTEVARLKARLADVAAGQAFLVQGGECAEGLGTFDPAEAQATAALLRAMGREVGSAGVDIVHVARLAGQFAKPRSAPTETIGGVTLPAYRGDAVNGAAFCAEARAADPKRMLRAWSRSRETLALLGRAMASSHEALLLPYEQGLARRDAPSGTWWAGSAHMVWIGERTRAPNGAHVEFARGIANPVGIKCGPGMEAEDLLRLLDTLDPGREPGRIVLIPRMGRENVGARLPKLMRAVAGEGRRLVWAVDPMHGNARIEGGRKTRHLTDILVETAAFFDIAASEGVWAGGVHLEISGTPVAECTGGTVSATEEELAGGYRSLCDPRLNPRQAMDLAGLVARRLAALAPQRARAA